MESAEPEKHLTQEMIDTMAKIPFHLVCAPQADTAQPLPDLSLSLTCLVLHDVFDTRSMSWS